MMIKIDLKSITMRCKKKCPMKIDEHELFEETHRKSDNRTKKEEKKD
jgi:L-lactate utilization protein LutB